MRKLDDHLDPEELASLPDNLEALTSKGSDGQLLQHLQESRACFDLAQTHSRLRELRTQSSSDEAPCPTEEVWLELAEGLRPEQSSSLLAHAAKCSTCAGMLREAMSLMQSDQVEKPMEGLESTTDAWQQRLATQLMSSYTRPISAFWRIGFLQRFRSRPRWVFATATAAVIVTFALIGVGIWHTAFPSEARLLALAYNQQRTLTLRIPGGEPVPLASGTRGTNTGLTEPVALLELRVRAQKHLEQTPNSAYWRQVMGEVNLLDGDGLAARRNLEIAQTIDDKLPNLQSDLAAAWFEIGNSSGSDEAFAEAAELYSKELRSSNRNQSLLYYNRALCWERLAARENALDDLRSALSWERSTEWRKAIEAEIERVSARSSMDPQDGLTDATTLAIRAESDGVLGAPANDNYEASLAQATEQLLPRWKLMPDVRAQIVQIAKEGLRHRDYWLHDWVEARHTPMSEDGDRHLASAAAEGASGDTQTSLLESRRAVSSYTLEGNLPGKIRAQLAEIYALQRLDRAHECLTYAHELQRERLAKKYAWVRTQLDLEDGSCSFLSGNYASAHYSFDQAAKESVEFRLDLLHLRALGGQAQLLDFRGNPLAAWQIDAEALRLCAQIRCPPIREYLLIYNMAHGAETLGLHYVAAELMHTGVRLAATSGDATTSAYAIETLAMITGRSGDYATADQAFAECSKMANAGNSIPAVDLYRAEWQTDRAEILLRRGEPQAALKLLKQSGPVIIASDYHPGRLHFFTEASAVELAIGDSGSALTNAVAAVREAESTLRTLRSPTEREQWQRENATAYAELIKVYRQRKEDKEGLEEWEHYRAAAYDNPPGAVVIPIAAAHPDALAVGNMSSSPKVLIIALVDQTYIGWLVATQPLRLLRTATLGDRADLHSVVTTFYHLCSDRDSNLSDIRAVGGRLYLSLLQPFADQFDSSHQLWLDVDPSLASIPVSALTLPDGSWLGAAYQIRILPAWWTIHPEIFSDDTSLRHLSQVVVVNGFETTQGNYSEASDVARLFPHATLLEGVATTPQNLLNNLRSAELFHFSGHASSEVQSSSLMSSATGTSQPALDADAVNSLDLRRCRIAVLAACNTTASSPTRVEPLPDLRNALLRSGVHAVVASHWDVDDQSTRALMLVFYQRLTQGISPARSLQLAEQSVRSEMTWRHPYYWASFQLFAN